jgi:hypothetical protein
MSISPTRNANGETARRAATACSCGLPANGWCQYEEIRVRYLSSRLNLGLANRVCEDGHAVDNDTWTFPLVRHV